MKTNPAGKIVYSNNNVIANTGKQKEFFNFYINKGKIINNEEIIDNQIESKL